MSVTEHNTTRTSTEDAIVCCQCRGTNTGSRQFCGQCGARLREPCLQCHSPQAVDVAFCGECGAKIQALLEERRMEWELTLARSRALSEAHRWPDAIGLLCSTTDPLDSRLQECYSAVVALRHQVEAEWAEQQVRADQLHQRALEATERCDFHGAQQVLQAIPAVLVTDAISATNQRVTHAIDEMSKLSQKVRQALAEKSFDDLLPTVFRLKQLRPHDHALTKLHEQLQQRHASQKAQATESSLRRAIAAFRRSEYAEMSTFLRPIDAEAVPPSLRTHYQHLVEAQFELQALESEPFAAPWLESIIRRLRQRCRHDERLTRRLHQMTQSLSAPSDSHLLVRHWPSTDELRRHEPTLGIPVEWWAGLPDLDLPEDDAKVMKQHSGSMTTAFGLALQALGEAAVAINLVPRTTSWLDRLTVWPSAKSTHHKLAWGIDIGTRAIKAIQLTRDTSQDQVRITRCLMIAHERSLDDTANDQEMLAMIAASFEQLVAELPRAAEPAVVGFPTTRTLGRTFELPPMKRQKVAEAIAYEARVQIPIPLENIVYDWHICPHAEDGSAPHQVFLLAARRDHLNPWVQLIPASHFRIVGMQNSCVAISNAAAYLGLHTRASATRNDEVTNSGQGEDNQLDTDHDVPSPSITNAPSRAIGVLEIGAESSTFVACGPHHLRFRAITWGSHRIERALMQTLSLDRTRAAACSVDPGKCVSLVSANQALLATRQEFVRHLQRALQSILAEGVPVERIYVTGGGASTWGTLRTIVRGGEAHATSITADPEDG